MTDKKICEVTILVCEELKNAINDGAMYEYRKPSEIWRVAAELYLFVHHHRYLAACSHAAACQTLRGKHDD